VTGFRRVAQPPTWRVSPQYL